MRYIVSRTEGHALDDAMEPWRSGGLGQGIPTARQVDVIAAANLAKAAIDRRLAQQCLQLLEAATACEEVFSRRASEIRLEAASRLALGAPPSLRQLVGVSHLEVPMNQVLGWMLNPDSRGAAARLGLLALGRLLDFPALVRDISQDSTVTVWCEATPDLAITSRQPDLLIGTESAALLIENKVWSPESGPDQYSHYLDVVTQWARGRECRAYLLAPTARTTPLGWDGSFTHRQLAHAMRPLVADAEVSFWDRVVYALIVSDLDPDPNPDRVREIERLLEASGSVSDVAAATKLSHLLRHQTLDPTNGRY